MLLLLIFVVLVRFSDNTSDKQSQDHQLNKLIADDELSQSIYKEVDTHQFSVYLNYVYMVHRRSEWP